MPPFVPPSALFEPVVELPVMNVLASLIERKLVRYTPVDTFTKYDLTPNLCDGFCDFKKHGWRIFFRKMGFFFFRFEIM